MSDSVAVNVLGTLGAVFWSIQLIPQIILNYRRSNTKGLQPSMMLLWACAGLPLGIHNILANLNIALQVQPQILTLLSLLTWSQCMYYGHGWSVPKCTATLACLCAIFGGVEVAFVAGFKYGYNGSAEPPAALLLVMAILSAVGLGLGVLRHYWDIWTHRTVRGISWTFILLDAAGDLSSLVSIVILKPIDSRSAAIYATELVLWLGVLLAGLVFNLRHLLLMRYKVWLSETTSRDPVSTAEPNGSDGRPIRTNTADSHSSVFRTASNPTDLGCVTNHVGSEMVTARLRLTHRISSVELP